MESTLITDALAAALATGEPKSFNPTDPFQYAVVPEGYELHDLERYAERPRRIARKVGLRTVKAFLAYVERFKTDGTIVFADLNSQQFQAVLDYSQDAMTPDWHGHIATYQCPLSTQWKTWTARNSKLMTQTEFAQFIEDNLIDIVEPSGADMLTISKTLQAKKKVDFKSAQTLSNGDVQFTYNETTDASAGQISVPETFKLGLKVFEGGDPYEVTARLRYRIKEGQLAMWYDLLRPERMVEDAFAEIERVIREKIGGSIDILEASI